MTSLEKKLKNPVWYSLKETHHKFMIEFDGVLFYHPDICVFGSFYDASKISTASNEYSKTVEKFFLVTENQTPVIDPSTTVLEKKIDGCQMVLEHLTPVEMTEKIVLLTEKHIDEIYDLIWLVMPGFYRKRGFEMGRFFGIFKNEQLIAIASLKCLEVTK